jgi:hypothetical protein
MKGPETDCIPFPFSVPYLDVRSVHLYYFNSPILRSLLTFPGCLPLTFTIFGVICPRIYEPLLVTTFMMTGLALLGPPPPLYNRLSARFTILLPPLVPLLNLRVLSSPIPYCLHGLLSLSKTCQILPVSLGSIASKDPHPPTETPEDAQGRYQ